VIYRAWQGGALSVRSCGKEMQLGTTRQGARRACARVCGATSEEHHYG
jgi:hypothetical protein